MSSRRSQRGAALLAAMLTVTLVTVLAASALWQQWRGLEVQAAERGRSQQTWVLLGALDWARRTLSEDARAGAVDHLSEPWAIPLQELRLSAFLAIGTDNTPDIDELYLSTRTSDLQSRLNVSSLVRDGKLSEPAMQSFARLFTLLRLPPEQLQMLAENLRLALGAGSVTPQTPLAPQRVDQLIWLGLPSQTLAILRPHITLLPQATTVNLNTASAQVIYAAVPGIHLAQAQSLVSLRSGAHFRTVPEALNALGVKLEPAELAQLSVSSRFFEFEGRSRLGNTTLHERAVMERRGLDVLVLWRERVA